MERREGEKAGGKEERKEGKKKEGEKEEKRGKKKNRVPSSFCHFPAFASSHCGLPADRASRHS